MWTHTKRWWMEGWQNWRFPRPSLRCCNGTQRQALLTSTSRNNTPPSTKRTSNFTTWRPKTLKKTKKKKTADNGAAWRTTNWAVNPSEMWQLGWSLLTIFMFSLAPFVGVSVVNSASVLSFLFAYHGPLLFWVSWKKMMCFWCCCMSSYGYCILYLNLSLLGVLTQRKTSNQ